MAGPPLNHWAVANRKIGSMPESRLRSELHHRGYRFRKNLVVREPGLSVRPDVVFPRLRLAVFVDGCFWHSCPQHGGRPSSNPTYWAAKLAGNVSRDRLVDRLLRDAGWHVVRLWEHVQPIEGANEVAAFIEAARSFLAAPLRRGHLATTTPPTTRRLARSKAGSASDAASPARQAVAAGKCEDGVV